MGIVQYHGVKISTLYIMSDIEYLKNILVDGMKGAEILKQLDTGEKKQAYVLSKFETIFKDDYNNYSFMLSGMIDIIIAVHNREIKKGNKNIVVFINIYLLI